MSREIDDKIKRIQTGYEHSENVSKGKWKENEVEGKVLRQVKKKNEEGSGKKTDMEIKETKKM